MINNRNKQENTLLLLLSIFFSEVVLYIYDIWLVIFLYKRGVAELSGFYISQLLPAILLLFVGITVDKVDRKKVLITTKILRILLFVTLLINNNTITIYIITFLFSLSSEVDSLMHNVLIPQLVEKVNVTKVSSLTNVVYSVAMIIGPIIASVLIAYDSLIIVSILIFCLILSTIPIPFMQILKTGSVSNLTQKKQTKLLHGTDKFFSKNITKNNNTVFIIITWSIFMIIIGMMSPLEIIMIESVLQMDSIFYAIGNTVEGVGTLLASVIIMAKIKKTEPNNAIKIGLVISTVGYLIIGVSSNISVYFLGAVIIGMTAGICPFGFRTSLQLYTQNDLLGRTYSLTRLIVLIARTFGLFLSGIFASYIPTRYIYIMSVSLLLITAFIVNVLQKTDILTVDV